MITNHKKCQLNFVVIVMLSEETKLILKPLV